MTKLVLKLGLITLTSSYEFVEVGSSLHCTRDSLYMAKLLTLLLANYGKAVTKLRDYGWTNANDVDKD